MANPTYQSGFYAPGRGTAKYPELWDGCVGAWNPGLGNTGLSLRDWSGNQNNGTLTNGPTWGVSDGRQALDFDGVNDRVLCGIDTAYRTGLKSISLSMLVYTSSTSFAAAPESLFDTSGFNVTAGGIWIALDNRGGTRATNGIGAQVKTSSGGTRDASASNVFTSTAAWKHICVAYFRGSLRIFVNGIDATTGEASNQGGTGDYVPKNEIISIGATVGGGNYFTGQMNDIRQFNRALSPNEIRLLAQRPGIAYERAPRKFYSLPAAASSRQYRLFRPSILRGA